MINNSDDTSGMHSLHRSQLMNENADTLALYFSKVNKFHENLRLKIYVKYDSA